MILDISGKQVIIDDEDYERVMQHKWYVNERNYVSTWGTGLLLHRFVLGYSGAQFVDHFNCNPLDNRKANLRVVTQWENQLNRIEPCATNTSGRIGVHHNKSTGKYEAYASIDNQKRHLGVFDTLEEAAHTRQLFVSRMLLNPELREKTEKRANNTSGFTGVSFVTRTGKWKAKKDGRHLGFFDKKEDAIEARRLADEGKL